MRFDHSAEMLKEPVVSRKPEPEQADGSERDDGGFYEFCFHAVFIWGLGRRKVSTGRAFHERMELAL